MALPADIRLRLRIHFGDRLMMGPGKADLLAGIERLGSISAAGREMKMSYRRAWSLIEEMNAAFAEPVVIGSRGGAKGGGAELTEAGRAVLSHYRHIEKMMHVDAESDLLQLQAMLRDIPGEK